MTKISADQILMWDVQSGLHKVTFGVVEREAERELVIAIRGTLSLPDTVTDLNVANVAVPEISEDCLAHEGSLESTREVLRLIEEDENVQRALKEHPDWRIVVVGHSLGGMCTILLTLILEAKYSDRNVRGFAFAPPKCISKAFIDNNPDLFKNITTVVYNRDLASRISTRSVLKLRIQIQLLVSQCTKPVGWIVRESFGGTTVDSIVEALGDSPYVGPGGWETFDREVNEELTRQLALLEKTGLPGISEQLGQVPGILHMVSHRPAGKACCYCCNENDVSVYSAKPESFEDIYISSGMTVNHLLHIMQAAMEAVNVPVPITTKLQSMESEV